MTIAADLQASLRVAMRARDAAATRALRSALSAVANAEAVAPSTSGPLTEGAIAGAVAGVGATDVARRELSETDVEAIVRAEIDERVTAATDYERLGAEDRAAEVRAEAEVLRRHVDR
jgi:uncharacterized protein YqeY